MGCGWSCGGFPLDNLDIDTKKQTITVKNTKDVPCQVTLTFPIGGCRKVSASIKARSSKTFTSSELGWPTNNCSIDVTCVVKYQGEEQTRTAYTSFESHY